MYLVTILCGYIVLSYLLNRMPWIIHKPKQTRPKLTKFKHWVIAHRGGSAENPENTMAAFEHAARLGVDMLEMDVVKTKDDVIVVAHDNHLERLCGIDKFITDCNYNELPAYQTESFTHFLPSRPIKSPANTRFTTLRKVFESFPGIYMMVEPKVPDPKCRKLVKAMVEEFKREELTVFPT